MHIVSGGCTGMPRQEPPWRWLRHRIKTLLLRLGLIEDRDDEER
jgi:hypothetical protein